MAIKLDPLPYAEDALKGVISAKTIEYHYHKHHQGYLNNTNNLIKGTKFDDMSLEEIVLNSEGGLFNNSAQAYNHNFYWKCMTPTPSDPSSKMQTLLKENFGSFEAFKEEFLNKAATLFGSGWCWLERDNSNKLSIVQRSNADTPMIHNSKALLVCDVWEHAYYIDYKNARADYLKKWFDIINWEFVESNL